MHYIRKNSQLLVSGAGEKEIISTVGTTAASATGSLIGTVLGGPPGAVIGSIVGATAGEVIRENADEITNQVNKVVFSPEVKSAMMGVNLFSKFVLGL